MRSTGSEYWTHCTFGREPHGDGGAYFVRGTVRGAVARGRVGHQTRHPRGRHPQPENYVNNRPTGRRANRHGFIWNINEEHGANTEALHVYKELHGDWEVPISFAVPSEALWPEDAWVSTRQ